MSAELRTATPDDAPAIKRLLDEHALASFGASRPPNFDAREIREWLTLIGDERNTWLAFAGGDLAAGGWLMIREPGAAMRVSASARGSAAAGSAGGWSS